MALFDVLKALTDAEINTNGIQYITGERHNLYLHELIDALGARQVHFPTSQSYDPGEPENNEVHVALPGIYAFYLTALATPAVITAPLGLLVWTGGPYWTVVQLTIPSAYDYFQARTNAALLTATPYTTVAIVQSNGGWEGKAGQWVQIVNRRTGQYDLLQLTADLAPTDIAITFKEKTFSNEYLLNSIIELDPQVNMKQWSKILYGDGTNDYIDLPDTWMLPPIETVDPDVWLQLISMKINKMEATWDSALPHDLTYDIIDNASSARVRIKFERIMLPSDEIIFRLWQPRKI